MAGQSQVKPLKPSRHFPPLRHGVGLHRAEVCLRRTRVQRQQHPNGKAGAFLVPQTAPFPFSPGEQAVVAVVDLVLLLAARTVVPGGADALKRLVQVLADPSVRAGGGEAVVVLVELEGAQPEVIRAI